MINGSVTAISEVAQAASLISTSVDIQIPGRLRDGTGPLRRSDAPMPRFLIMTINVSDIPAGTPDLDIQVFIVDQASGEEEKIGEVLTIATAVKQIIMIGVDAVATPTHINAAIAAAFGPIMRIKGVTDVGTSTPTITYTVGLEIAN